MSTERKVILMNALKNIHEQKITLPKEAWILFKKYIDTGESVVETLEMSDINRKLHIKLFNNKKKSSIVLNTQLTESVRRSIINEAIINAMSMVDGIPEEVFTIFNDYVTTGKEYSTEIDVKVISNSSGKTNRNKILEDRSMVIRLYNTKDKKSYVCLRKM